MAFDLVQAGGYGSGDLGALTVASSCQLNSVGVFDCSKDSIQDFCEIEVVSTGADGGFSQNGGEDLNCLFVLACLSAADSTDADFCYLWTVASVSSVSTTTRGGRSFAELSYYALPEEFCAAYQNLKSNGNAALCVYTIPQYHDLTLNSGIHITPAKADTCYPGILAFKCSGTLTLNGGHIDLRNKGINTNHTASRPVIPLETNAVLDTDKYSGWENSDVQKHLACNIGDGACFIIAKKVVVADSSSRIGNPNTSGAQFYRGATDSRTYNETAPANVTNIGGSTILLVAGTIEGFDPAIIAKYRSLTASEISSGSVDTNYMGLARCYIASGTKLRNDEGLYAYDCISDPTRVSSTLNIRSFGDGSDGTATNYTGQLNNYLAVTARDSSGKVFTYSSKTGTGLALFKVGALVMIYYRHIQQDTFNFSGEFILARVLGITDTEITVDTKITPHNLEQYEIQLITIPQFSNFTLSTTNSATPKYENGMGGICAIAVNGTCNISGGVINVEGKGGTRAYGRKGLAIIGNAQDCDRLPLGTGHGSVFILAKNLTMNASTRIGASYSGAAFGGTGSAAEGQSNRSGGGFWATTPTSSGSTTWATGGYGDGGDKYNDAALKGLQGSHVMIVADKITGFNQSAIATGGAGGYKGTSDSSYVNYFGGDGGAGYGGGGGELSGVGYSGGYGGYYGHGGDSSDAGAGGAPGWAFVYCNQVVNQDTTNTVYY